MNPEDNAVGARIEKVMKQKASSRILRFFRAELQREGAYLLPLRLFIGIGWVRASLEKLLEAPWHSGAALTKFLNTQLADGHVVFPFYRSLITDVFAPNVLALSWIIIAGQLLVGAALMAGACTNFALLCGMFMNLNFILAGRVNPSAFYMVIQTVLFIANTGSILGLDYLISKRIPFALVVAQPQFERKYLAIEKWSFLALSAISAVIAIVVRPHIRDYSPSSVDDPAMLILVLAIFGGLASLITYFRLSQK